MHQVRIATATKMH